MKLKVTSLNADIVPAVDEDKLIGDYEAGMQRNTAGRMHFVRACG